MKKIISLVIFSFIFIFLLLESTAVHAKEIRGVTEKTIRVGLICDLTGPASGVFNGYLQSIRTYFKHVNDHGGLRGRKLKLIVENDRYTIPGSIAAYKKLVYKDKVLAILGMGGSGQHKALYDRIEKDRIPVITLSASWHVTRPIKRYSFQPINDAGDEMKLIANYLINVKKVKNLRLAFVYADLEAGKMALDQLEKSMNHFGRQLVGKEILGIGDIDASTQVLALKRVKASHVAFIVAGSGILSLFRDAKKLAYHPTFVATFHAIGEDIVRTAGEGVQEEKLAYEMEFLDNLWENIQTKNASVSATSLLHQELNVSLRAVRDLLTHEADKLIIDSRSGYEAVLSSLDSFMPSLKDSVELYEGTEPIFDAYNLEGDISRTLQRKVF